ncbi:uncharacterized protein TRAVEDRAFT_26752 [Trametes versicolor FP-101664 SS1]|uniref:uncharacterized protein n=1 Tax=Trametes versicolor (strain FP-101664) TaxID=717944 RepID=UPI00046217A4|nr:uncharacterized protein TRAVEDRAFT_26752 [Trametes versicolor FP-101664 SS1]EIW63504.1 hypothetical protein TRAVEDRAFT_26752 [Trametes versicolor FP-101664 SS1]
MDTHIGHGRAPHPRHVWGSGHCKVMLPLPILTCACAFDLCAAFVIGCGTAATFFRFAPARSVCAQSRNRRGRVTQPRTIRPTTPPAFQAGQNIDF